MEVIFSGWALGWLALLSALGAILGRAQARSWFNPVSVLGGTWCAVTVTYALEGSALYPLGGRAVGLVALGVASIVGGGSFMYVASSARGESNDADVGWIRGLSGSLYDEAKLARWYRRLCVALTLYFGLQLVQVAPLLREAGGINGIIFGGSGLDFRRAYLSQRFEAVQSGFGAGGIVLAVLGYGLFVGCLALVPAGYYAASGAGRRALYPLMVTAAYSFVLLERSSFLYSAGIFGASYLYHRSILPRREVSRRSKLALVLVVVLMILVAVVPALIRAGGARSDQNGQADALSYFYAGLSGLNGAARVDPDLSSPVTGEGSPVYSDVSNSASGLGHGHGAWTLHGVLSIANRLGLRVDVPPATFAYTSVGPRQGELSNIYTFAIYPYYDFGFFGVAIFGFLLGCASVRLHLAVRRKNVGAIVPASIMLTTLSTSFFGLALLRDFRYLFLCAVGYIAMNALRSSPEQLHRSARDSKVVL